MKIKSIFLGFVFLFSASTIFAASLPPVEAKDGMAVSAQHLATQVGIDILNHGGNAIDAAVAMGYALAVVAPCCGNIGGGGFMLIHFADGKNTFINFREKAPMAIKASLFLNEQGDVKTERLSAGHIKGSLTNGYLPVGIPGTVLGLNTALEKYGTFTLKQVISPSIPLAQKGFKLKQGDVEILKTNTDSFKTQPNVAAIFLKNQKPLQVGDYLIQRDLANTLSAIAQGGAKVFYQGKIADAVVKASQQNGGVMTKQDFLQYTVEEQQPVHCQYRGYEIITAPPPASGATVCEILNIAQDFPLSQLGYHSAASVHYTVEAMRYAYADRNSYLGDPNFVKTPIDKLISPEHAKQIRNQIKPDKAIDSHLIGFIAHTSSEDHDTTSYVVVDKKGNAVSVTYTINDLFGSKVLPDKTGFFLNNELSDFTIKAGVPNNYGLVQGTANLIAPGKRPLSAIAPTIVTKDQKIFMVLGTPGGSTIPTQIVQTIQNVIDYGMNIQEAVDAPRYHMQWLPDQIYLEPYVFSQDTLDKLTAMGYRFKSGSPWDTPRWGAVTAILKNPQTGVLEGAMDSRRSAGLALGIN